MDLTIIESNPKVASVEFNSNFSYLKVFAYKPGETNIIIYKKSTRKILDVFRVSVDSTLELPAKFNLTADSTIKLFKNDEKKAIYIKNLDAQWVSSNPKIVEVTADGFITAHKEGEAYIRLENFSGTKVYLKTQIIVSSLNKVKLELANLPAYITRNKNNSQYQLEYR